MTNPFINNPIISRELVTRLRLRSSFLYLFVVLLCGYVFMVFLWSSFVSSMSAYYSGSWKSRDLFIALNLLLGGAITAISPLFSASLVNVERERGTWDLLRTTPLSVTSILVGKIGSSILFVWFILSSLIPLYGILLPLGGISLREFFVPAAVVTEVIFIVSLIGFYCSVRWDNTIKAITMTYFFGFMYVFGLSFSRIFIGEIFFGREQFGYELLLSPCIVLICYFANETLPNGVGKWAQQHPYSAHAVAVLILVFILLILCYFELNRLERKRRKGGWYHRFLSLFEIGIFRPNYQKNASIFPDGSNSVFVKDLRLLFGGRGVSKTIVIYALSGFLFIFCVVQIWNGNGIFQTRLFSIAVPFLTLFPFLILPTAVSAFRREIDRDTYTLLATTTLSRHEISRAKKQSVLSLFLVRFASFISPILLVATLAGPANKLYFIGHLLSYFLVMGVLLFVGLQVLTKYNVLRSYSLRKTVIVYLVFLCIVCGICLHPVFALPTIASIYFFLSMGTASSFLCRKTVNAYLVSFGAAMSVYFIVPSFFEILTEINRNAQWYLNLKEFQNLISPFFLVTTANRTRLIHHDWLSIALFQAVWMVAVGLLLQFYCRITSRNEY